MGKGDSFALINRKKVMKTMTYNTSEFKITLKNFEVEELFNHFDVFGLEEIELDNGILSTFGYGRWGVAQRGGEQYLVLGAEKMMPIGDDEHFYISDLKGMEKPEVA